MHIEILDEPELSSAVVNCTPTPGSASLPTGQPTSDSMTHRPASGSDLSAPGISWMASGGGSIVAASPSPQRTTGIRTYSRLSPAVIATPGSIRR